MQHRDALSHPAAVRESPPPPCTGELVTPAPAWFGDAAWEIFTCAVCGAQVATVGGRVHWWNHELRPLTGVTAADPARCPTCFGEGVDGFRDAWLPCARGDGTGRVGPAATANRPATREEPRA